MEKQKKNDEILLSTKRILRRIRSLLSQLQTGNTPAWLSSEHYIVSMSCRSVLEGLRFVKKVPFVQSPAGKWIPYAFTVSDTIAPEANAEMMAASLSHFKPDETFLRIFPLMRTALVLCRLEIRMRQDTVPLEFGQWILQLHRVRDMDWTSVHDALSAVEASLSKDPSGTYPRCDDTTKAAYRDAVYRYAKKYKITEEEAAAQVLTFAEKAEIPENRNLAVWLFKQPNAARGGYIHVGLYAAAITASVLVCLWLWPYGFWASILPAVFLLLPFYALFREGADMLAARLAAKNPHPVLRLKLDRIPEDGRTLVITTTLLSGKDTDQTAFRNLERFYLRSKEDNVYFGLLADLPASDSLLRAEDDAILQSAGAKITALNEKYGERFCLFIRGRKYSPGEGKYMGWERKRGAVLTLVRHLRGLESDFIIDIVPQSIPLRTIRYVCTLDADTELPPGAVRSMVSAMLHPSNRPVIAHGRVIKGTGILQPSMSVTLSGATATRFTLLCTGKGGIDPYSRHNTDGESVLYGEGSFCGKGIFDVDAYLAVLDGAFPKDTVLSHDFLEGGRLRCLNLPSVTFSDRIPAGVLSYFERQSRWVRGDVQALRFAFSSHRNASGQKIRNPLPIAGRLRVIDHVLYALIPAAMVRCALVVSFFPYSAPVCAALWAAIFSCRLLRPLSLCLRRYAWRSLMRQFAGLVLTDLRQSVLWLCIRVQFAAYEAWVNLKAVMTALYRMCISHRHMLSWVTAGEAENKKRAEKMSGMFSAMRSSVLLGILLLFSPHLFAKFFGLLWICAPLTAWYVSAPHKTKDTAFLRRQIRKKNTEAAYAYAYDIWRYFSDHVTETSCHLPPDNVQWFPGTQETTAERTSPTNIGLYLLSCVAACDFGYLAPDALAKRLDATVSTLERMETYHGHYYNWYNTRSASVLGTPYVSTVDSGNLACALIAAAGGADDHAAEESRLHAIADRMRRLAERMDFSFLYNEKKAQLALGYDAGTETISDSYYDLYCSEARSAVYFACAMGQIPAAAWEQLSRPITESHRRIGVLSWTGSAFEYFMPALWLPVPEYSFSAEMLDFAARMQYGERTTLHTDEGDYTVFGKSEGAYFAFDAARNFQYQPCGVQTLALRAGMDEERLVMPYALFLMLPHTSLPAADTLAALRSFGMYGKYGFYEALDMTAKRVGGGWAIVRSVMAHHLGMSLVALANTAFDSIFQRRFAADARMEAMEILLWEKIPADAPAVFGAAVPETEVPQRMQRTEEDAGRVTRYADKTANAASCRYAVLSNTQTALIAAADGGMRLLDGTLTITVTEPHAERLPPMFFLKSEEDGNVYSPCAISTVPERRGTVSYSFLCTDDTVRYEAVYDNGVTAALVITISPVESMFSFTASLSKNGKSMPYTMTFLFRPVLFETHAYAVHPTFADLFLLSSWDAETKTLQFRRRSRQEGERDTVMTLTAGGLSDVRAEADAQALLGLGYDAETIAALSRGHVEDHKMTGSAVVPIVYLQGRAQGKTTLRLRHAHKDEIQKTRAFDAGLLAKIRLEHRMLCGGISPADDTVSVMLRALTEENRTHLLARSVDFVPCTGRGRQRYWKYGISGDLPILMMKTDDDDKTSGALLRILNAWKYLLLSGIRCDLVLTVRETDAYGKPVSTRVRDAVKHSGLEFFLESGGVGTLHVTTDADAAADGLYLCAAHVFGGSTVQGHPQPVQPLPAVYPCPRTHNEKPIAYHMSEERIIVEKGRQYAPWTFMLTNGVFSTLVSLNTLGFTFFTNARECRVTPWYGEPISERCGEHLYLRISGDSMFYDLCCHARTVVIMPYEVHYLGIAGEVSFRVSVSVPDRRRRKKIRVFLKNEGNADADCVLRYQIEPLMGALPEDREAVVWERQEETIVFSTETNAACAEYRGVLSLSGVQRLEMGQSGTSYLYIAGALRIPAGESCTADAVLAVVRNGERSVEQEKVLPPRRLPLKPIFKTGIPYLDPLANTWLPLQIVHVRMYGRCGYYQPGGAYGFRDQLQDAMAAALLDPALLKTQIFRAAAHQYVEGDVQHWWHPEPLSDPAKFHRGIRSRCADDYLWLPLAAARYIKLTGDDAILDQTVRYIESPVLTEDENERYEEPLRSSVRESLYMHCIRAIEHGFRFGVHGLPLIGIGDWNDGMNAVGVHGQGESVWMGMFFLLVLHEFLPLCRLRGDEAGTKKYAAVMKQLASAVDTDGWNGQWYYRAWYDDGTPIGTPGDAQAEIDLLPQAFAAIVNHIVRMPEGGKPFDDAHVRAAVNAAYDKLFDAEREVFALLSPPFTRDGGAAHDPGYIAGYIPGTRENGGQYTHAAVWGAMGLFAAGEHEKGMRVLRAISPVRHTSTEEGIRRYQKEPYALCGDVLMTPGREGEGGWSQYTGSAAWYYRLLYEVFGQGDTPSVT